MTKGNRRIITTNARKDILNAFESAGITCIFVNEVAASLYHTSLVPQAIDVVVMAQAPGLISVHKATRILLRRDAVHFRLSGSQVRYYDPSIPPPKKDFCKVTLIPVPNPPPPSYEQSRVQRLLNFPVVSVLPVVYYAISRVSTPKKGERKSLLQLLESLSKHEPIAIDEEFHRALLAHLERIALFSPQLELLTSKFMRFCRGEATPTAEARGGINGVPDGGGFDTDSAPNDEANDEDDDQASVSLIGPPAEATTGTGQAPSMSVAALSSAPSSQAIMANAKRPSSSGLPMKGSRFSRQRRNEKYGDSRTINRRTQVACLIARRVVDILHGLEVGCAIFGSVASYLYGNRRNPNDIDILTFPPTDSSIPQESLKEAIQSHDSHFFLQNAKDPQATYRILYFRVDEDLAPKGTFRGNKCKIDILTPGTMHLPSLTPNMIQVRDTLPVIPYPVLLLQKVQAWDDHSKMADVPHKYRKRFVDAKDVLNLLKLEHIVELRRNRPWADRTLFSEEFIVMSTERVREFYGAHPESRSEFVNLGF